MPFEQIIRKVLSGIKKIDFNLDEEITVAEGRLFWNKDEGTLNLGMPGGNVNLQIGQEELIKAKNTSGITITNGTPVYVSGASGINVEISPADASIPDNNRKVIAVATEDISSNHFGYVTTFGLVRNLNTGGCTAGDELYVAVGGGFTNTKPELPNGISRIGYCVVDNNENGIIFVNTQTISVKEILTDTGDLIVRTADGYTLEVDKPVWEDINIGGLVLTGPASTLPGFIEIQDSNGNGTGIFTRSFDIDEDGDGFIEIPHEALSSGNGQFHIHFSGNTAPTGTDKVAFQLTYFSTSEGDLVPTPNIITAERDYDTQYSRVTLNFENINLKSMQQFGFNLKRINASINDYPGEVQVWTIGIHYQIDTLGSRGIITK